jgi:hypothetical protein
MTHANIVNLRFGFGRSSKAANVRTLKNKIPEIANIALGAFSISSNAIEPTLPAAVPNKSTKYNRPIANSDRVSDRQTAIPENTNGVAIIVQNKTNAYRDSIGGTRSMGIANIVTRASGVATAIANENWRSRLAT